MSDVRNSQAWKDAPWRTAEPTYADPTDDVRAPGWEEAAAASTEAAALVPHDAPLAPDDVTGNLRRYARWQWKDYWQRRGFWLAGAALFGVWVMVHYLLADRRVWMGPNGPWRWVSPNAEEVFAISHICFAVGGVLAGLLGAGGIVARERERGLQRFLFAKPVNAVRYYLQGLAVNGVGSLLVLVGAILVAALTAGHALAVGSIVAVAVGGYLLGSGLTFLVSTLWRYDAPLAGAYLLAGMPVIALAENGYWWGKVLQWLFPQGWAMALVRGLVPGGPDNPASATFMFLMLAAFAAAWGAAATVAGVAVLRRRSIQT